MTTKQSAALGFIVPLGAYLSTLMLGTRATTDTRLYRFYMLCSLALIGLWLGLIFDEVVALRVVVRDMRRAATSPATAPTRSATSPATPAKPGHLSVVHETESPREP